MRYPSDINLLPRKKVNKKLIRNVALAFVALAALAGVVYAGVVLPQGYLQTRLAEEKALDDQLAPYGNFNALLQQKQGEIQTLQDIAASLYAMNAPASVLESLETIWDETRPELGIGFIDLTLEKITLRGRAKTDSDIYAYAVRLKETGKFLEVLVDILKEDLSPVNNEPIPEELYVNGQPPLPAHIRGYTITLVLSENTSDLPVMPSTSEGEEGQK